jgi:acetolactate synthase-1/2/3 large subunit
MVGMHGFSHGNHAINECDVLIGIGMRFDDRVTGRLSEFAPNARVIHIDVDPAEIGKNVPTDVPVVGDARETLKVLNDVLEPLRHDDWLEQISAWRRQPPSREAHVNGALLPQHVIERLHAVTGGRAIVTTDVGQHQMWVAQALPIRRARGLLTSGGLGSMGFGLPAAIGAALATEQRVWCISGDGSLLINIQELATLAELALDVTVIVLDNGQLGMVRQQQQLFYAEHLSASCYERPTDLVSVARGFGVPAYTWQPRASGLPELSRLLEQRGPQLIRVPLTAAEMVLPVVPAGAGNHEMLGACLPETPPPIAAASA